LEALLKGKNSFGQAQAAAKEPTAESALEALWLADSNRVTAAKAVVFDATVASALLRIAREVVWTRLTLSQVS